MMTNRADLNTQTNKKRETNRTDLNTQTNQNDDK